MDREIFVLTHAIDKYRERVYPDTERFERENFEIAKIIENSFYEFGSNFHFKDKDLSVFFRDLYTKEIFKFFDPISKEEVGMPFYLALGEDKIKEGRLVVITVKHVCSAVYRQNNFIPFKRGCERYDFRRLERRARTKGWKN